MVNQPQRRLFRFCSRTFGVCLSIASVMLVLGLGTPSSMSVRADEEELARDFEQHVIPYLNTYCRECHNSQQAKGELDVTRFTSSDLVIAEFREWKHVIEFVRQGEMPPEDAPQPNVEQTQKMIAAVEAILLVEAQKHAGDPGVVLPRRLSNTEFDASIRDLIGFDLQPTRDFPTDPAGGEGFDNTGEALRMSPSLLKKYLAASQQVANHLVLKPSGIQFAPYPVTSYNERKKFTEQAVIDFYQAHAVEFDDYLEAAWRWRYRVDQTQSIEHWAESQGLSGKYLRSVSHYLTEAAPESALLLELQSRWEALPPPTADGQRPSQWSQLMSFFEFVHRNLHPPEPELIRSNAGNWPIAHLAFRAKVAAGRTEYQPQTIASQQLIRIGRIREPNDNQQEPVTLRIFIEQPFRSSAGQVLLEEVIFSQADHLPRNDRERTEHKVRTLKEVLEAIQSPLAASLSFGGQLNGQPLDDDSLLLPLPVKLEIPLTRQMQQELAGMFLLATCKPLERDGATGEVVVFNGQENQSSKTLDRNARLLLTEESEHRAAIARDAEVFCRTFPSRFFYVDDQRGLAAGFHLVEGFFRDDRPLVELVLSNEQVVELNRRWEELDFVTQSTETLLRGFVWFERSEREVLHDERFDFLRSEDPQLVEASYLERFEKLYLDRLGIKRIGDTLEAENETDQYRMIRSFFRDIRIGLERQSETLLAAEENGLRDLWKFAERAYRRPLSNTEIESLSKFYQKLRDEGQDVEGAMRSVVIALLMSPQFSYRQFQVPVGAELYPLSNHDLAARLSYFLWSSLPDDQLMQVAESGDLHDPQVLEQQTRRMLADARMETFSREFLGQWLRFRDYLEKDPIDASAFTGYDDSLRHSLMQEPIRLATYLIQTDQSLIKLLDSDETFLNETLARHYGGQLERAYREAANAPNQTSPSRRSPNGSASDSTWYRVSGLQEAGRGGLLGMGVILTKNSAGQRTSPVKRGFWTVHHLLGQHFPPPPAQVPELPASEAGASQTIRELLAAHVADPQCAMCHRHFDSLGLAMEGFDAIGRVRTHDSGGRQVDPVAELPNGQIAQGIPELIRYIKEERRDEFLQNLCRKFLGYALGRSVMLSDQPLLDQMQTELERNDYRFSTLFVVVVQSPQFRMQRGRDFVAPRGP